MPDPLNVKVQIPMDASSMPSGPPGPPHGGWISQYASKAGYRWKVGERKNQILPYNGTVWRSSVKTRGTAAVPWTNWYYQVSGASADHTYTGNSWINSPPTYGISTWNRAYDRFREVALGENATWGTTIAEGREALGLIGGRAYQLATAYRSLRNGRFDRFCKELGIRPKRRHRRYIPRRGYLKKSVQREIARGSSALWLEYWFGWAPLAGEIYQSTLVLTTSQSSGIHWATASTPLKEATVSYGWSGSAKKVVERGRYSVKTGAVVHYDNPNAAMAQQLGLANPLAIAWELVPFSFVVDWFTNVGDLIGDLSNLYGVRLTDAYTSEYVRTTSEFHTSFEGRNPAAWWVYGITTHRSRRRTSLARTVPVVPRLANFGSSLTRAATAVSLLTQLFIKG